MSKEKYANFRGAEIVKVMRIEVNEGDGTTEDPVRRVVYYVDVDGEIISHDDPDQRRFRGGDSIAAIL
jgi:hypothetical protein